MGAWGAIHMAAVYNGLAGFRKTLVSNVHSDWMSIATSGLYYWQLNCNCLHLGMYNNIISLGVL